MRVMVHGGRGAEYDTEDDRNCDDNTAADAVLDLVLLEVASRGVAGYPDAARKVKGGKQVGVRFVIWDQRAGAGGRVGVGVGGKRMAMHAKHTLIGGAKRSLTC